MSRSHVDILKAAIQHHWSGEPGDKAKGYVDKFFNQTRTGTKIAAQVEGNYGTYTVSIEADEDGVASACSCYIGGGGGCHHCAALATTFLNDPSAFKASKPKRLNKVQDLTDLRRYLKHTTLDALLKRLKANGTTQKAFAESIGMNPRHLTSIKSCELRNRYYNELGATKLACLWVLEHFIEAGTE